MQVTKNGRCSAAIPRKPQIRVELGRVDFEGIDAGKASGKGAIGESTM
ncbi:MAG: hypothetical protein PHS86_11585 [Syntrophaceae bacterium]|nr:hypothetical protein [Syntrophaceae bacterium]